MKIHAELMLAIGLSVLAAMLVLLLTPEDQNGLVSTPSKPSKVMRELQKPAFTGATLPGALPPIEVSEQPLSLERFKTTSLPPEVLKRDIWLFSNTGNGSAKEFRDALSHHFPSHELELGMTGPDVLQCLKSMSEISDGAPPWPANELGRIAPDMPLIFYIHRVLNQTSPQEERNRFCRIVDSLVRMSGEHPNEQVLSTFLFEICGNCYFGWAGTKGKGAEAASAMWRSSELFRHLVYGQPPVSEEFREMVRTNNAKVDAGPFSTVPETGK
jgi:hypothetical protein